MLRRTQFAYRPQLALADHVHEFDTGEGRRSRPKGLEPQHRSRQPFNGAVVLFDDVVTNIPILYPTSSRVADVLVMEVSFDPGGPAL